MITVLAVNGSPRKGKGNTALVLSAFIEGMIERGADVEQYYASSLKPRACVCGGMQCWYETPGECCIKDDMQSLYPNLKAADILVLATPVYIPLPGDIQNFINRLCPLVEPRLEFRAGRTRARFREDVNIKKMVLVSTGGWWERGNMDTLVRVVAELAEDASVEFAGAVLRPHAFVMKANDRITTEGQAVLEDVKIAGTQLIQEGRMDPQTLENISRPLISEQELRSQYNQLV